MTVRSQPRSKIHPSPALIVRADTPISECILLMRKHDVGSLLIVSDRGRGELVGIFTERDLVKKIDLIQSGGHWKAPIRTLMTRPVRTLPIDRIHDAAEIMLAYRIRHLPVVVPDEKGRDRIVGVISIRDLLRSFVEAAQQSEAPPVPQKPSMRIGIITGDAPLLKLMDALPYPPHYRGMICVTTDFGQFSSEKSAASGQFDLFIVDIDGLDISQWPGVLRRINRTAGFPKTVVLFSPSLHDAKTEKLLGQLSNSQKFTVLAKPVDLVSLATALHGPEAIPALVAPAG